MNTLTSLLYEASNDLNHTALGQELLNGMGDIQVNNPLVTFYIYHTLWHSCSDRLAPVIFISKAYEL